MSYAKAKPRILALHAAGWPVKAVARLAGVTYHDAYNCLYHDGLEPNLGPIVLPAPSVRSWSERDLALALGELFPTCKWIQLAQRLAFQYGEAEALRRLNGYASERAAA